MPTWDDLMYEIYVRQAIERGIADSDAGRVTPMKKSVPDTGLQAVRVHFTDAALQQLDGIIGYISKDSTSTPSA